MKRVGERFVEFDKVVLEEQLRRSRDSHMLQFEKGLNFRTNEEVAASIEEHSSLKLKGAMLRHSVMLGKLFMKQAWNFASLFGPLIRTQPASGMTAMPHKDGKLWTKEDGILCCRTMSRDKNLDVQHSASDWNAMFEARLNPAPVHAEYEMSRF